MSAVLLSLLLASAPPPELREVTGYAAAEDGIFEIDLGFAPAEILKDEKNPQGETLVPARLYGGFKVDARMDRQRSRFYVDGVDMTDYLLGVATGAVGFPLRTIDIEAPEERVELQLVIYEKDVKAPVFEDRLIVEMAKPELVEGPRVSDRGNLRIFKRSDIPEDVLKDAPPEYRK